MHCQEVSDPELKGRWNYLISEGPHTSIQWVSIINSILVVFFLTILVAIVLVRTLRRDFLRYDKLESEVSSSAQCGIIPPILISCAAKECLEFLLLSHQSICITTVRSIVQILYSRLNISHSIPYRCASVWCLVVKERIYKQYSDNL